MKSQDPWDCYICPLRLPQKINQNVGKYTIHGSCGNKHIPKSNIHEEKDMSLIPFDWSIAAVCVCASSYKSKRVCILPQSLSVFCVMYNAARLWQNHLHIHCCPKKHRCLHCRPVLLVTQKLDHFFQIVNPLRQPERRVVRHVTGQVVQIWTRFDPIAGKTNGLVIKHQPSITVMQYIVLNMKPEKSDIYAHLQWSTSSEVTWA